MQYTGFSLHKYVIKKFPNASAATTLKILYHGHAPVQPHNHKSKYTTVIACATYTSPAYDYSN